MNSGKVHSKSKLFILNQQQTTERTEWWFVGSQLSTFPTDTEQIGETFSSVAAETIIQHYYRESDSSTDYAVSDMA